MVEGAAEKAVFDTLLDRELLTISRVEILGEKVNKCRTIKKGGLIHNEILSLNKNEEITIIRVLDKNTIFGKLPQNIAKRPIQIKLVLTKQEIEILHIISDGMLDRFLQNHSGIKPSEYLSNYNKQYNKSEEYWTSFLSTLNNDKLLEVLKTYEKKRKHTHSNNELSFYDLIKDFH